MKSAPLLFWTAATFVAGPQTTEGSGDEDVASTLTSATIHTTRGAGYQFEIKLSADGGISDLTAVYDGQRVSVPKAEIPPVKKADLRQAHVKVRVGSPYPLESATVVIPFQQEFRRDPGDPADADDVRVSNVVRIIFNKGEFVCWEMAVSLGEESNSWALTEKENGGVVQDRGKETQLTNPYWTRNAVSYSTPGNKEP